MGLQPYQEKIIEQLIRQERMLSELYTCFAGHFPKYAEFWNALAEEERRHARLIEKLRDAISQGKVVFDEKKIKTYTLDTFIERLEDILTRAKRGEFNLASAFAHAVDYESALIEKNVFSHFDSLSGKIKGTLGILQKETAGHVDRIKEKRREMSAALPRR